MNNRLSWLLVGLVGLVSVAVRFIDLDRASVRSDEINFLNLARPGQSVVELWRNPPWQNQIPLADCIPVIWHWFRTDNPDERTVREPFALLGSLTVVGTSVWLMRRRGIAAGFLLGMWMALLPFHVYQSREAYYYIVVMAFASGMTLCTVDLLVAMRSGNALSARRMIIWSVWTILTCLTHMSTWVVAGICWLLLLMQALKSAPTVKQTNLFPLFISASVTGLFFIRWIWRAIIEMQEVSQADGHIGGAFGWVGARVVPFFTYGANMTGFVLSVTLVSAGIGVFLWQKWKRKHEADDVFNSLSVIVLSGFAMAYAYIGIVGGGAAKVSYFSALLPVYLVWAVYTIDMMISIMPRKWITLTRWALLIVLALLFTRPALAITHLDGKPVAYEKVRSWLDANLEAGSVVVVDRWYEPWNEMALYAPSNVNVTFTVPDEPYSNYTQLNWRQITQETIESGKVNAFIRLTRNHEDKDGLWQWPETYFARYAAITNDAGLWLRLSGFATSEDFYSVNTNRLVVEIFYDLREDELTRRKTSNEKAALFFNPNLPYEKSGPMGIFRLQTEQFMDWRMLQQRGELEVYNLTDAPADATIEITAVSPNGTKLVTSNGQRVQFPAGQMQRWNIGPVKLEPGKNLVMLEDPRWAQAQEPLLIAEAKVKPVDASGP